ncbi:hypothetical protein D9615_003067 [Tricholomella constricta]|uniref:Non-haem dioxygenase N-terminal domain-containing protein n=1 Tax=Tricholomella constricta TaxID=117010 RepID=A0A8H5HG21_9AGAR|nr:hypothetical protein D9615_003067 [Tricholomella constricta]
MTGLPFITDMADPHLVLPSRPAPGFFLASRRTESTFEEIPVIDFTDARSTDPAKRRALADLIRDASINVGFFYLKNHGISEERVANVLEASKRFFALDISTKMELQPKKLDIGKTSNFKGYTALLQENVNPAGQGDLHEGFDIGWEAELPSDAPVFTKTTSGAMSGTNVWPSNLPGFKEAVLAYYHDAIGLGKLLFPLFALALDLSEDFFDDKTTRPAAIMRILHYPPQSSNVDAEGRQIGIGEHTDYEASMMFRREIGTLTESASLDRVGGLQVKNAAGKWLDAVHIPETLVVKYVMI